MHFINDEIKNNEKQDCSEQQISSRCEQVKGEEQ